MFNIVPSKEEKKKLKKIVSNFLDSFKDEKDVEFFVGGSYAKDTWLPGNRDVDIFVKFNYKLYKDQDISSVLYVILRKKFKDVTVVHGSRDYFHIVVNDIIFEVVPVLDIKKTSEAMNVMDVSPLHVKYIKKKLKKKDDVRKLKFLLKANHLYGAESYLQGFSGYVSEILVSHYSSFDKVIKAFSSAGDSLFLDPAKHYSSSKIALKSLNRSKLGSFVLIDPVQSDRNAAAGVSLIKLKKFVRLCKDYDGSDKWFELKEVDVGKLKDYLVLAVKPLEGKRDISLAKCVHYLIALFESLIIMVSKLRIMDGMIHIIGSRLVPLVKLLDIMDPPRSLLNMSRFSNLSMVEKSKLVRIRFMLI